MTTGARILSASTLIGDEVRNSQDEDLGHLKEIMFDTQTGDIAYGVLSHGGVLGIGDKLFAIPWQAFSIDTGAHCLRLDVPKDRLKAAPGFDKDDWPDFADPAFASTISDYYGYARPISRAEATKL